MCGIEKRNFFNDWTDFEDFLRLSVELARDVDATICGTTGSRLDL